MFIEIERNIHVKSNTRKMTKYDQILQLATDAHGDQKRKYTGDPYIVHPISVAEIVSTHGGDDAMVYAALLHDVLEDTPVTSTELLIKLHYILNPAMALDVHSLVVDLTDVYTKENFPNLNRKTRKLLEAQRLGKAQGRAQTVKYADLIDNGFSITEHDPGFAKVYLKEKQDLLDNMKDGDPILFHQASNQHKINI